MNKKLTERYKARARVIKAMAHPTRLYIVDLLAQKSHCVGDITQAVQADISTISKHLSILKNVGIIEDHRDGTKVYYELKIPCVLNFFGCVETVLKESGQKLVNLSR